MRARHWAQRRLRPGASAASGPSERPAEFRPAAERAERRRQAQGPEQRPPDAGLVRERRAQRVEPEGQRQQPPAHAEPRGQRPRRAERAVPRPQRAACALQAAPRRLLADAGPELRSAPRADPAVPAGPDAAPGAYPASAALSPGRAAEFAPSRRGRRKKSPPPPGWPRKSEMSCVSYEPRPPVDRSPPLDRTQRAQRSGADLCSNANNTTKLRRIAPSRGGQRKRRCSAAPEPIRRRSSRFVSRTLPPGVIALRDERRAHATTSRSAGANRRFCPLGRRSAAQARRSTSCFLISAIALAGLRPFGQALEQLRMVWQR